MSFLKNINFGKLKEGLSKTKDKIVNKISESITGKVKLDTLTIEEIESSLLSSDLGYDSTEEIIEEVRKTMVSERDRSTDSVIKTVKRVLTQQLEKTPIPAMAIEGKKPFVLLVIGVNGAGKTTTIGKLSYNFKQAGFSVMVGAADTFRAAANEQLEIWAQRAGVEIVQKGMGVDPSSVVFETVTKAKEKGVDIVFIDTAGRLHTKHNLMEELKKINRVIGNIIPNAPHEVLLVLDGTTGQNALVQAKEFSKTAAITGLVITKLDGTAKGGAVFQISRELRIPIRYVGVGEGISDLQDFDPKLFVEALFE